MNDETKTVIKELLIKGLKAGLVVICRSVLEEMEKKPELIVPVKPAPSKKVVN